jgi:tetratricopeptide (TPR) repeat protein
LGEQYLRLSKPDIAEDYFKKAINLGDNLPSAYIGLIKTYHLLGKKNKIGGIFRNYLSHFPEDNKIRKYYINHLYMTGNFKKTAKEIEKYSAENESDSITGRILAKCYLNTGEYKKAMIIYRQLLRKNPQDDKYLLSYAYCLDRLSETENAINLLQKSRSYIKNNVSIELTIGVLSARLDKEEEALNAFKKALEINEKEWRAYYNISKIYEKQGLNEFAVKFKTRAEQLKKST